MPTSSGRERPAYRSRWQLLHNATVAGSHHPGVAGKAGLPLGRVWATWLRESPSALMPLWQSRRFWSLGAAPLVSLTCVVCLP
jgi:hypothetical protein